jgi:hypothetical protein
MSDTATPETATDLLEATPATAYFWGYVAGDGDLTENCVTVRTGDETAADALGAIAGVEDRTHSVETRESAHDTSLLRVEDEYELQVFGTLPERASAAFGLPMEDQPGGYRFGAFDGNRAQLLRGILEACGTVCFRESANAVGISFVHDDKQFLETVQSLLEGIEPAVPTEECSETSSGGYWFGLADEADTEAFAHWVYTGSESSGLYADDRRQKLRRSIERATGATVGTLSE